MGWVGRALRSHEELSGRSFCLSFTVAYRFGGTAVWSISLFSVCENESLADSYLADDASVAKVQVPDAGSSSTSAGGPPPSGPQIVYHVVPQGHHVHPHHHHHADQPSMPGQAEQGGLVGRPSPEVARARAMRRFWSAFFVAWAIWIFLG